MFLDNWEAKTAVFPDFEMTDKPAEAATVTVSIETSQVINKVPQYVYGNNAVTYDNGLAYNATAMTDLKNLNPHVLRWPGGSLSNSYFWNGSWQQGPDDIPSGISAWGGQDGDWNMSLNQYYDFLENTNNEGCIVVNYSYARYGTSDDPVAQAAHLAADWVRYDNGRTKFWEIGNENYGNWEEGHSIDLAANKDGQPEYVSGQLYGEHCVVFIDSMRAAAAEIGVDINIGLVVYDSEESWDAISEVWNEGLMPLAGHLADFLSVHSYFTPYDQDSPPGTILNSHNVPGNIYAVLEADMAEAGKEMLPVAMTEWNIFAVGSMQQVSYVNGMHGALTLGALIENGYGMGNRWNLVNGWNDGNDHAMFSSGEEPGVDDYNPRPAFFYMYYFQNYFGDKMVESTVTGSNSVVSYASSFSSGECGIVLINKGAAGQTVELDINNFESGDKYYTMTLTGGTDNGEFSRKVYLNGLGTDEEGGGPDEYEDIAASALETEGGISVDLPPMGVVYVLVEKNTLEYVYSKVESDPSVIDIQLSDEVIFTQAPTELSVTINWSGTRPITNVEVDPVDAHWIHITLDAVILPTDDVSITYKDTVITTVDGLLLQPFISKLADNLLPGAPPKLMEAETNEEGSEVYLKFNKEMTVTVNAHEDFSLVADDDPDIDIALVGATLDPMDSKRVILDVSDPIYADYTLRVSYSGSSMESSEAVPLGTIFGFLVENLAPGMSPEVVSAETNEAGNQIIVEFSKPMQNLSGEVDNFTVMSDDVELSISSISNIGSSMTIVLEQGISFLEEIALSYNGSTAFAKDRGQLMPFSFIEVENKVPVWVVFEIPGTIDAEQFTYNEGMQLEECSDDGGGQNLGYIDAGDWVSYRINVSKTGYYKGLIRTAAANSSGQLLIQAPDADIVDLQTVTVPVTGDWQSWTSVPVELILYEGEQWLKLYALTNGFNINWLSLEFDKDLGIDARSSSEHEIRVYPNPASNRLFIRSGEAGISSLEIIDITGKKVMQREYDSSPLQVTIDLDISEGLYLVKLNTGSEMQLTRLIVQ